MVHLVDVAHDVFKRAVERTVERCHYPDLVEDACRLLEQKLDMRAMLADDIAVVAPGLIEEIPVPVALVCPEPAIDCLEAAEGIGGEGRRP